MPPLTLQVQIVVELLRIQKVELTPIENPPAAWSLELLSQEKQDEEEEKGDFDNIQGGFNPKRTLCP